MNAQDWIAAAIALGAFVWLIHHFRSMVDPGAHASNAGGSGCSKCSSCGSDSPSGS